MIWALVTILIFASSFVFYKAHIVILHWFTFPRILEKGQVRKYCLYFYHWRNKCSRKLRNDSLSIICTELSNFPWWWDYSIFVHPWQVTSIVSDSVNLWIIACQAPLSMEFSRPFPGVGSHYLLQGTFPTKGSNPGLLNCMQILYSLRCQGSPYIVQCGSYWPQGLLGSWNVACVTKELNF